MNIIPKFVRDLIADFVASPSCAGLPEPAVVDPIDDTPLRPNDYNLSSGTLFRGSLKLGRGTPLAAVPYRPRVRPESRELDVGGGYEPLVVPMSELPPEELDALINRVNARAVLSTTAGRLGLARSNTFAECAELLIEAGAAPALVAKMARLANEAVDDLHSDA